MHRTRFYIGLVTKDHDEVSENVVERCAWLVAGSYGDCTIYQTIGYWGDEHEPSMVIEALTDTEPSEVSVVALAKVLAILANQSAVLWSMEPVKGGFVKGI